MRVRYQIAGDEYYRTECDLSEKHARSLYENCKTNALCMWAELVGENDDDYMDVLESFEHINLAITIKELIG